MKTQEVRQILEGIPPGTTLRLTYKEECPKDPFYLLGMENAGKIQINTPNHKMLIYAIHQSGNWGRPENRIFEVVTTSKFYFDWFSGRVAWPLESLEVLISA